MITPPSTITQQRDEAKDLLAAQQGWAPSAQPAAVPAGPPAAAAGLRVLPNVAVAAAPAPALAAEATDELEAPRTSARTQQDAPPRQAAKGGLQGAQFAARYLFLAEQTLLAGSH